MLEKVRRWVQSLGAEWRRTPVIVHRGRYFTPEDILREVEAGTELGRELQEMLDKGIISYSQEDAWRMAKEDLIEYLRRHPDMVWEAYAEGRVVRYTGRELLEHVIRETPIGRELIRAHAVAISYILSKYLTI